jgi:hypothetical protein
MSGAASQSSLAPSWTELSQLSVALLAALGGFLLPPPAFLSRSAAYWPTPLVVLVATGLLLVAGRHRRGPAHTRLWVQLALGSLALALGSLLAHRWLLDTHTCGYYGKVRVIGQQLTSNAAEYLRESPVPSCEELLKVFTGRVEEIWTRSSLAQSELLLTLSYVCVVPLLAACAIATLQAVRCSREERAA